MVQYGDQVDVTQGEEPWTAHIPCCHPWDGDKALLVHLHTEYLDRMLERGLNGLPGTA